VAHVRANDLQVYYREWSVPRPIGAVVFVHGNWSTHRWWIPTAAALAPALADHRLLAIDLRGRGDTQGPDHGYTIAELAGDLLGFLDALGLARVHLVGHSLGSAIVTELARSVEGSERVASLVAVAPCWVDGMPPRWARREDQARLHADRAVFARLLAGMAPKMDPKARDPLWEELIITGHRQRELATLRNLDALLAWQPGDTLGALTMPRIVVDGELDPLCGGSTAARAAEAMACERVTLAGIGHSPNLEAPEQLASIIRRVIRRDGSAEIE
jgi:3-oxoadipate enol-lactonase